MSIIYMCMIIIYFCTVWFNFQFY